MKIGVIGGTFDPIHLGHIAIARAAYKEYELDQLWFMPAGAPYFKDGEDVTSPEMRLEMTRACVDALPGGFLCSDFEISETKRTYSALTFERLNLLYPEDEFYFIVGYDSLRSFRTWYKPEKLLANAVILCAARKDDDGSFTKPEACVKELCEVYAAVGPDIRVIHTPTVDISSTMIRERVRKGLDISELVTKETAEYIYAHGLYGAVNAPDDAAADAFGYSNQH